MTSEEAILAVIDGMEKLHIPYMVVGSFSSNFYGVERSTRDVDFVIQFSPEAISAIARQLGPEFHLDPQLSFESVTLTSRHIIEDEDVIVTKLHWAMGAKRSKDRDDILAVIAVQGKNINWAYVHAWCDQHGTRGLLDEIRRSIPVS